MAGCCPPAPPSRALGANANEGQGPESEILPGENVDCFARRSGNLTGLQDDNTDHPKNKISNTTIPVNSSGCINVQFEMTPESEEALRWTLERNGTVVGGIDGTTFSSTGLWSGCFSTLLGKTVKVKVRAYDAVTGGEIMDVRSFTFSPTSSNGNNSIKFVSPLPGGIVNSKYGPRIHPITKSMKAHTGIDMKMVDRSVVDVVAAADGEVIFAGGTSDTGYGLRVHIKHSTSSGKHICTTTYNHLSTYYVSVGDKVMASQKIGKEGSTGSSTGNHLHFECKMPNGLFVDPEPYIFGQLTIAKTTQPDGTGTDTYTRTSESVLSDEDAKAKQVDSCESFGGTYPDDVVGENYKSKDRGPEPPEPPSTGDIFPYCFTTAMKQEIGPFWNESSAAVISGSVATPDDRKQVGFVDDPIDRGGLTKYGVSQNANRTTDVKTLDLSLTKNLYYNKYFKASKAHTLPNQLAVMHFDAAVNHGISGANSMLSAAGGATASADDYAAERLKVYENIVKKNPSQSRFTRGWSTRVNAVLAAAKAV